MFDALTKKFQSLFSSMKGLTEESLMEAAQEVRSALLEADVNYSVAGAFVQRVKEKAIGLTRLKGVSQREQFIKIIHDELVSLMGSEEASLSFKEKPSVILLCGLQGSGKTTQAVKLAYYLKEKRVLLAACDLQRPAAQEQLKKMASSINIPVFAKEGTPLAVAEEAFKKAKDEGFDVLIIDTAGRLHIDEELMQELVLIRDRVQPEEILFVASAQTGQDAVKTASEFDQRLQITGTILTMLDGDARAGAALSIREVTKKPLKFEGVGEKVGDLRPFHPRSMADRILGMGDLINLVRKAEEHIDKDEEKKLEEKLRKATFTFQDYLSQMKMMRKMGSMKSLLKMMPGLGSFDLELSDKHFAKMEAVILSMTPKEREEKVELEMSRRKRIAKGSGVQLDDVNRFIKGFKQIKQLIKHLPKKGLSNLFGGNLWQ